MLRRSHLTLALVQYSLFSLVSLPPITISNPHSLLMPQHSFKNFRNAHVLPSSLKTLKSLCLQDKIQTTYLKWRCKVCHLKKGIYPKFSLEPYLPSPNTHALPIPTLEVHWIVQHWWFCSVHTLLSASNPHPTSLEMFHVLQGQLKYHLCKDALLSSSCWSLKEGRYGWFTVVAL